MHVETLTCHHFRNIVDAQLTFSPGRNVIVGQNGQGKTNLLEGLYLLSHARSHRAGEDKEMVHLDYRQEGARVAATLHPLDSDDTPVSQVEARFLPVGEEGSRIRTQFRLEGRPVK